MDVETSAYQAFKLWLGGYIPLERNTLHILFGLALASVATVFCRRGLRLRPFAIAFAAALLAGTAMELADRRDDIAAFGHWRLGTSLLDLGRTILFPASALIAAAAFLRYRNYRGGPKTTHFTCFQMLPPEANGSARALPACDRCRAPACGRSI